ncbi:hypothetical protein L227DRAFT_163888 [Lentinus tigrinus ALCF2SS1-6]|uniref:F-box domain-containing protein n=1 Tax=Lentinus tigrinus ALCF2SS1-6 TaxID=1328759 RepID=A0A5C2S639_9APHY|nr:hypothetical protein L227DRAFT_163888 [Lentinus tigrinus ALCF2SS1-6]
MAKPYKKSSGKRSKARGGNIGRLSGIMRVPLDILFEIASHLEPLDILQLARTSKEYRRLLLSRKSRHVWVTARERIAPRPLLDPPEGLSEPLYAALLFEPTCMACGSRALTVDYALQVRFCRPCWKENIIPGKILAKEALEDYKLDDFFNLLPAEARLLPSRLGHRTLKKLKHPTVVDQHNTDRYYWIEFSAVAERFRQVCELRDDQAYKAFVVECVAATLARLNFHLRVVVWERERHIYRYTMVEHRLQEYGYKVEDYPPSDVDPQFHHLLWKARHMKPRTWKTIRPKIIEHLEVERSRREALKWTKRQDQLKDHYRSFRWSLGLGMPLSSSMEKHTLPNFRDALQLPCMATLLVARTPEVDITKKEFVSIKPTILAESQAYRARVRNDLVQIVVDRYPDKNTWDTATSSDVEGDDADVAAAQLRLLEDPATLFCCGLCGRSMSYLGILEHWQTIHGSTAWTPQHVRLPMARSVSRLLTALSQVSPGKTHSSLRRTLENGRVVCACGSDPLRRASGNAKAHLMLNMLQLKHVNSNLQAKHLISIRCIGE